MLNRIKSVVKVIDKHGVCGKKTIIAAIDCSYATCSNDTRRLIGLRLIKSYDGKYSLTARGHAAIVNKFKDLKYLEPHRVPTKEYRGSEKDEQAAHRNMLNVIFFMSITEPRIPCWE